MLLRLNGFPSIIQPPISPDKILSDAIFGGVKEYAKHQTQAWINGALEAVAQTLVDLSYSVALIGGGISILLWISGLEKAKRWTGILIMSHVLIRFLLGGI